MCGYKQSIKYIYRTLLFGCMIWLCSMLVSCAEQTPQGTKVLMSCINFQKTKIVEEELYLQTTSIEDQIEEVLTFLSTASPKLEYQVPLSQDVTVLNTDRMNETLVLNLSEGYKTLDAATEILTRASLVKSLTQIEGISKVNILVKGEPLKDHLGKLVGNMTADMFIDNAGKEISTYEKVTIRLYFTNEEGNGLVAVERTKAYNTNISLDRFVMEELIKGPESTKKEGVYPTISPNTKLLSTYVKDNTCYVNFDSTFLTQVSDVQNEVIIYSVVNTLCNVPGIDKVQIIIDGKTDVVFHGVIPLSTVFSRNLTYLEDYTAY